MCRSHFIVIACAIALTVGCASNKSKHAKRDLKSSQQMEMTQTAEASTDSNTSGGATAESSMDAFPGVDHPLAGKWSLAMPRRNQQSASITARDGDHIIINAGENLSGEYVVQGSYLLILTRDEKLRPIA